VSLPKPSYLLYFDQVHLTLSGRQRSLDLAREIVEQLVGGGSARAMVVSSARSVDIVEPLTDDAQRLVAALERLEHDRDQWDLYAETEDARVRDIVDTLNDGANVEGAIARARSYQKEEVWRTTRSMRRLGATLGQLVDLEPPKGLIYFADVVRSNPGEHYLTFFGSRLLQTKGALQRAELDHDLGALAFDQVMHEAAAQGIRIYTVEARGLVTDSDPAIVSTSVTETTPASARLRGSDTHRTFESLAAETGGRPFLNGVRASRIAERIEADSSCVYLLSFDPSGFAEDAPLRVDVKTSRSDVELHVRGQLVLPSAAARRTASLLRAFSAPNSIPDPFEVVAGLVPTGWADGKYSALLQIHVAAMPLPEPRWELGASVIAGERVRHEASGSVAAGTAPTPVTLESEVRLPPGVLRLVAVAHETRSGLVSSSERVVDWPALDGAGPAIGPIVLLQPEGGAFVREHRAQGSGALLVEDGAPLVPDRPAAFVAVVCGRRGADGVADRRLRGQRVHEFPPVPLDGDSAGRCVQIRDVIPSNTLGAGVFRYEIDLRAGDRAAHGSRDFVIADPEVPVPEEATSGPKSAIDAAAPWREAPGKEE
jgi:VWFA-related protein